MGEPETVIRVEGLGKRYALGRAAGPGPSTLRDALAAGARGLLQRLRGRRPADAPPDEFWALKDIAFEVKRGDVVGVIGRNGAGKSTLLKLLSRITEPTAGQIEIEGRVASLLEVGTGFHPELTGRENVYLNGCILGMSRAEVRAKFDQIVEFAEVEKFLDTPVKRYSSGMYTRLAFAVAAHLESEVLVVDEVLAVGDTAFQQKCLGKMGQIARGGRTVLFVSHNLSVVNQLCTRGLYLRDGGLVAHGPVADVIGRYLGGADQGAYAGAARPDRPTVTSVRIDTAELARGHLSVAVGFESPVAFDPLVGVVVSTDLGTPLFGTNRDLHPTNPHGSSRTGRSAVTFPDVPLQSGTYSVSVWLGDGTGAVHEHLPDVVRFDFVSSAALSSRYSTRVIGPLRVSARWSVALGTRDAHDPSAGGAHERGVPCSG
ncbi:ABC transporter ATP-binding protein [Gemmata sp. JC673]|uniref:ABC transporter ATP-binding protein n=1 Tax=Gemmata algarum TaxID=2975278 RepID=A0ABU5ETS5_9BACT|nr:ABC transporter ATP-binding protein [Gemmata algarum]MDY3557852.1 ABC transporter ATP-binding protein [Gemmata algarum]